MCVCVHICACACACMPARIAAEDLACASLFLGSFPASDKGDFLISNALETFSPGWAAPFFHLPPLHLRPPISHQSGSLQA